jgi:hypothetical protein
LGATGGPGYYPIMENNIIVTVTRLSLFNLFAISLVNLIFTLFGASISVGFLYGYLGGIVLVLFLGALVSLTQRQKSTS